MADRPAPILFVEQGTKCFGRFRALQGISLELFPGELLGLLGPNGAGKTTLIRCLSGRSRLDSGRIRFAEGQPRDVLGVVPQSIAVYEDLTAEQNLFAFGRLHGIAGRKLTKRVDEALEWSDLADRRRDLAKTFSGGMRRRLNIACSVLHQPRILLLDEPTVGIDPQSRERIYEMLKTLLERGTAILLTTHQLEEAQIRCDRIAIIDRGVIVATGSFDTLVEQTIGHHQQLSIRCRRPPGRWPPPLISERDGRSARCQLGDIGRELPRILEALEFGGEAASIIDHVALDSPSLQSVFLHLTGKELRD